MDRTLAWGARGRSFKSSHPDRLYLIIRHMKSLVIYDSYFGNTEKIAQTVATQLNTKAINIQEFKNSQLEDIDLLIVGSPTRAFSPSVNIKNFLNTLPQLEGIKVGAFDTRLEAEKAPSKILRFLVKIFGYAAKPILKKLESKGGEKILEPIGFYVEDTEGPLREGEVDRAKEWVEGIK
jgi:flavodoxin I